MFLNLVQEGIFDCGYSLLCFNAHFMFVQNILYLENNSEPTRMELRAFFEKYPNESFCIEELKNKRLQNGLICKKCNHHEHSFRKVDLKFQCKKCGNRLGLRSGTVMENSNLPISYWMIGIELLTLSNKKISILKMQYLLGHKRYEPIWLMVQKIRLVMKKRDEKYRLRAYTEFDKEFLEELDKLVLKKKSNFSDNIKSKNKS